MAEASITSPREIFACLICLEQYQTPRSLPCLHAFCEECLDSYISSYMHNSTEFPCPVCRTTVILPNPKSSAGSWAQTFPLNHLIVTLMDGGMENKDDVTCTLCHVRDSTSVKAIYWCNDCSEGLCEKCYTYHQKNRFRFKHKSISLLGETIANKDVDENCPRHLGKILEVYCSDHSELGCVVCFVTKHKICKQVHFIDDVAEGCNVDDQCSKFICEMENIERELRTFASTKDINMDNVNKEMTAIIRGMVDAVDKVKVKLDSVRDNLAGDIRHKYEVEKQKIQYQIKHIQAFEKCIGNCCRIMMTVSTGTHRQAFVTFEKMKSQLSNHYKQLKSELTNDVDVHVKLHLGRRLASLSTHISLGNVDIHEMPSEETSDIMTKVTRHLDKLQVSSGESPTSLLDLMKANHLKLIKVVYRENVKLGQIDLAGGTFLNDGKLLIADFSARSHRLIMFNDKFEVVNTFPVPGQPTDVALGFDGSDIFVCLNREKIINYSISERGLIQKSEFTTSQQIWSVASLGGVLITGGNYYPDQVTSEEPKRDKSSSDRGCPHLIAKHDASRTYYYTDGNNVVCKKLGGEEVFRHNTRRPVDGIAVDQNGNAYVRYKNKYKTGGVYQVAHDGRRFRILVGALKRITNPYAIMFHRTKPVFVVVSNDEDTLFEVYEFVS